MGTNYYLIQKCEDACRHCSKEIHVHICKSYTSWQGYREFDSPFGEEVKSVAQWIRLIANDITEYKSIIRDEYNREVDFAKFVRNTYNVESITRRKQYDWVQSNDTFGWSNGNDFLDPDGFSFTYSEFT